MDGEDGGHQRARPQTARHPPKNQQQQDRRSGVQQHVGQVMDRGAVTEKVPDEHVRDARQRGPAFQVALGKHRQDAAQASIRR